jgi:hypothetical protein
MGQGIDVGIAARACWPNGVLIDNRYDQYQEALARTKALIDDPTVKTIFEAAFRFEGVLIRADVFERLPEGRWRLYEVKSSTSFHERYLEEITGPQPDRYVHQAPSSSSSSNFASLRSGVSKPSVNQL